MKVSLTKSDHLPQGCQIRAAQLEEKWQIQRLLRGLIKSEGLNFELRLFGYYLIESLFWVGLAAIGWQLLDRFSGAIVGLMIAGIVLLLMIAILRLVFICLGIVSLFISGAKNWFKYMVVECNRSVVACMATRKFPTHTIIYNLYVKPSWRSQGLGSALIKQVKQSSANQTERLQTTPVNTLVNRSQSPSPLRNSKPNGGLSTGQNVTNSLYLVCKPRLVGFYTRLGFVSVPWQKLPDRVKQSLNGYRPHPRLWGLQVVFMRWRATTSDSSVSSSEK